MRALLFHLALLLLVAPLPAQEGEGAAATQAAAGEEPAGEAAEPDEPPPFPAVSEVVPRVAALEHRASQEREEVDQLADLSDLAAQVETAAERLRALESRFELLPELRAVRSDEISRLRAEARAEEARIGELLERVSERSRRLEEIERRWREERSFFRSWRRELQADPGSAAVGAELAQAVELTSEVATAAAAAVPEVLRLQQQVQRLLASGRDLGLMADRLTESWERQLRRRNGPTLPSAAYFAELRAALGSDLLPGVRTATAFPAAFLAEHDGLLVVHLLVILAVASGARRLRRATGGRDRWRGLLAHPWALGVFASMVVLGPRYEPAPALWRLLLVAALAGSAALLAAGTFLRRRKRWPVYLLALLYLLFHACEALLLPAPLYRLLLVAVGLVAAPWLLYMARVDRDDEGRLTPLAVSLRLAAALLGVLVLAEVAGYHVFARWLLDASLTTTFVFFAVTFLMRLARLAIQIGLSSPKLGRFPYLARVAPQLSPRLGRLVKLVLVTLALLNLADVWDLVDAPGEAWSRLVGWSAGVGDVRVSVGQVLLAAAALYLAVVASWLLRAFLDEEVVVRRGLDRGVGDSIKTLLHYGLIVIGVLLGLSLAGVSLQSFAILAGAFGVGIGFGLQNVVNNFVSGIILLFERPVRNGDTVVVGGTWGTVRRIGLRSTVVETFDRAELIVPNSQLISETVTNWTLSNRVARAVLAVGVAYGSDYRRVIEILDEVARGHDNVLADPQAYTVLASFGDSAVNFELRAWIDDIDRRLATISDLYTEIAARLAAEGIVIPFPQRDLHVKSVEAPVRLDGGTPQAGEVG